MTCIVGLVDEESTVWIGGDSAGVADTSIVTRIDPKVWTQDGFAYGFTSSFRMGQLLRHRLTPPDHDPAIAIEDYLVGPYIDAVRKCLKKGGMAKKNNEVETGGTFLLGYRGRLFEINDDYQVGENRAGYAAVGCGFEIALGAMYSTEDRPPAQRITTALHAAAEFSSGVRAPFTVVRLEANR